MEKEDFFTACIDAFGGGELVSPEALKAVGIEIFHSREEEEDDSLPSISFITFGFGKLVSEEGELSAYYSLDAGADEKLLLEDFAERVLEMASGFPENGSIVSGQSSFVPAFSSHLIMYDLVAEELEFEDEVVPLFSIVPLLEEEEKSLRRAEPEYREVFITRVGETISSPFPRSPIYTARNLVKVVWEAILNWHANRNSYAHEQVTSLQICSANLEGDVIKIQEMTNGSLPDDLKFSLGFQPYRMYFHEFEYMSADRILSFLQSERDNPNAGWDMTVIPFAYGTGGEVLGIRIGEKGRSKIVRFVPGEGFLPQKEKYYWEWLLNYVDGLRNQRYTLDEEGFLNS